MYCMCLEQSGEKNSVHPLSLLLTDRQTDIRTDRQTDGCTAAPQRLWGKNKLLRCQHENKVATFFSRAVPPWAGPSENAYSARSKALKKVWLIKAIAWTWLEKTRGAILSSEEWRQIVFHKPALNCSRIEKYHADTDDLFHLALQREEN